MQGWKHLTKAKWPKLQALCAGLFIIDLVKCGAGI